jgi:hypothetical protein
MSSDAVGPWEHRPRAGWDDFVAARERAMARIEAQGAIDRLERAWLAPAHDPRRLPSTPEDGGPPPVWGA